MDKAGRASVFKNFLFRYRLAFQGITALLQNANFKGFFTGKPFSGAAKGVCVPGLNCYSCPGAIGACPIGSLQSFMSARRFKFPYYVLGLLIFFGVLLGRAVCGFLCPFGLLQDLLFKIPLGKIPVFGKIRQKLHKNRVDRVLRKLKYAVLVLCVIVLPLFFKLTPVFCKYICPSGTVSGILVGLADSSVGALFGSMFMWKVSVLSMIVLACVLVSRPFCRYLCPLGAFYAPFNKISLVRLSVDASKCVSCGKCSSVCGMGVDPVKSPDDLECIRCGRCAVNCPADAIHIGVKSRVKSGTQNQVFKIENHR